MSIKFDVDYEVSCDYCGYKMGEQDKCYCETCVDDINNDLEILEKENDELKQEIEELKNKLHKVLKLTSIREQIDD